VADEIEKADIVGDHSQLVAKFLGALGAFIQGRDIEDRQRRQHPSIFAVFSGCARNVTPGDNVAGRGRALSRSRG
jgi:hypothetical protein